MFSSEHAIWKFAWAGDEADDWLPFAEELVTKWSNQEKGEVEFRDTFEIVLAALLLEDDLLPPPARAAFARLTLETINEASANKLRVRCLFVSPPKPGRKRNATGAIVRFWEVEALIEKGMTKSEAYAAVAEKLSKSTDTIRREYERIVKKNLQRHSRGGNDC